MSILNNLKDTKILVVGDVMLDRYWWGSVNRISPEAPVPIVRLEKTSLVAGGAANVAANLTGLGATPYLFGITGNDQEAELLHEKIADTKISGDFLTPVAGRKTTIKTRIVAHSQHVVRIDQETADPISTSDADEILAKIAAILPEIDAAIISDYAKGLLTDHFLERLLSEIRSHGKMVFVDPKRRDFSKYRGASVITPNKREAAEACGMHMDEDDLVAHAGRELIGQMKLDALLITEGEHGMTLFDGSDGSIHLDPLAQNVFDVTGAGDTVIATFAAAAATGESFRESAKLANIAAGLVVGKIGTTAITTAMIEHYLAGNDGEA